MPVAVNQMDSVLQMANGESVPGGPNVNSFPRNRRQQTHPRRRTTGPKFKQHLRRHGEAADLGFDAAIFQNGPQHLLDVAARHFPSCVPSADALREEGLQTLWRQPLCILHGTCDHGRRKKCTAR